MVECLHLHRALYDDAGTAQSEQEGVGPSSATLPSFGSARTAESGLPDTPMSAAGSSQNVGLTSQVICTAVVFHSWSAHLHQDRCWPSRHALYTLCEAVLPSCWCLGRLSWTAEAGKMCASTCHKMHASMVRACAMCSSGGMKEHFKTGR